MKQEQLVNNASETAIQTVFDETPSVTKQKDSADSFVEQEHLPAELDDIKRDELSANETFYNAKNKLIEGVKSAIVPVKVKVACHESSQKNSIHSMKSLVGIQDVKAFQLAIKKKVCKALKLDNIQINKNSKSSAAISLPTVHVKDLKVVGDEWVVVQRKRSTTSRMTRKQH